MRLKSSLSRSRSVFFLSLVVLGGLIAFAGYLVYQQMSQFGGVVEASGSEVARLGSRVKVSIIITNHEGRALNYTYFVSMNLSSTRFDNFSQTVFIPSGDSFRFNLYIVPEERGVVAVTMTVYEGEERTLVDDVTHYIVVQWKGSQVSTNFVLL